MLTAWPLMRAGVSCAALARVMKPSDEQRECEREQRRSILSVKRSQRFLNGC